MNDGHDTTPDDVVSLYRKGFPVLAREPRLRGVMSDMLDAPGGLVRLRLGLLSGKLSFFMRLPNALPRPV